MGGVAPALEQWDAGPQGEAVAVFLHRNARLVLIELLVKRFTALILRLRTCLPTVFVGLRSVHTIPSCNASKRHNTVDDVMTVIPHNGGPFHHHRWFLTLHGLNFGVFD